MDHIFVVSDGTGRTAEQALAAAMTQFERANISVSRHAGVRTEDDVQRVVAEAARSGALIVHTIVTNRIRELMVRESRERNVGTVDLMGPLLARLSHRLAVSPAEKPGLFRQLNEAYFRRLETMEFALSHDDGLRTHELDKAEIVLLGVSRTFKTPLSVYLAFEGWFVANIPILVGFDPPDILNSLPPGKVFCLDTYPSILASLRKYRHEYLGGQSGDYADLEKVRHELMYAREVFRRRPGWSIISVANKPIEEIASEILTLKGRREDRGGATK